MKLVSALKERIDRYFDHISAEELYYRSITKYGFSENTGIIMDDQPFYTAEIDYYPFEPDQTSFGPGTTNLN